MANKTILKVLVGSRAHGIAEEDSDYDYRAVYLQPTSELLAVGAGGYKGTTWVEGALEDNTAYELGHFLHLATKSNPSILEMFRSPIVEITSEGEELLRLFPNTWSTTGVLNAFKGYGGNQRTKMFSDKPDHVKRRNKYAATWIRVLLFGIELLTTTDFSVQIKDSYFLPYLGGSFFPYELDDHIEFSSWPNLIKAIKCGGVSTGTVVNLALLLEKELDFAANENLNKETDLEPINNYLLKQRRDHFESTSD